MHVVLALFAVGFSGFELCRELLKKEPSLITVAVFLLALSAVLR
jgi:hypothetical protein